MSTLDLIKGYYDSQTAKNDEWKGLWAEEAVFSDASQVLLARGRQAVIQPFEPFLKGHAGLRITNTVVEGDHACFIIHYTYRNAKMETMEQDVAEVWQVRDGKLARLTIYFDLTAYQSFMRGAVAPATRSEA